MRIVVTITAALAASFFLAGPIGAQVPPHVAGTICSTPGFWCWANPRGAPGSPCVCTTPNGPVQGILS